MKFFTSCKYYFLGCVRGGGGSSGGDKNTKNNNRGFTVGGQLSGLPSGFMVLQNNATDDLVVNSKGTFTKKLPQGSQYSVSVIWKQLQRLLPKDT